MKTVTLSKSFLFKIKWKQNFTFGSPFWSVFVGYSGWRSKSSKWKSLFLIFDKNILLWRTTTTTGKLEEVHSKADKILSKYNFHIPHLLKTLQHKRESDSELIVQVVENHHREFTVNKWVFHLRKSYILYILYNLLNKNRAETL